MHEKTFTRHELIEAVFKGASEAAMFADENRRIVQVNPATLDMFGYGANELIGQQTSILYADESQFHEQGQLRFSSSAPAGTEAYRISYKRKSGKVFPSETIGGPVRDQDGEILGYFGLIRDISDQVRTENSLHELYKISTDQRLTGQQKIQSQQKAAEKAAKLKKQQGSSLKDRV